MSPDLWGSGSFATGKGFFAGAILLARSKAFVIRPSGLAPPTTPDC